MPFGRQQGCHLAKPGALIGNLDHKRSGPLMIGIDACNARFSRASVVPTRASLVGNQT